MGISATRFSALDKQYNVPVLDFKSITGSDIFNSPNLDSKIVSSSLQAFLDNGQQVPKIDLGSVKDDAFRKAKGALSSLQDLSKLKPKDLDKAIASMLPNNAAAQSIFGQMSDRCKKKGLSNGGLGKPYDANVSCGTKNRKAGADGCSSSAYGDVLNKMTGGAYKSKYQNLNDSLKNLISLSKFGYNMNMCGVFSALTGDLNKNVLSRASGALLGHLGATSNLLGVFDLAGSSSGLHTAIENPSGLNSVFNNLKRVPEITRTSLPDLSEKLIMSAEAIKGDWMTGSTPGTLSTAFADVHNQNVSDLFSSKLMEVKVNPLNLNAIPSSDLGFMSSAYDLKLPSAQSALSSLSGLGGLKFG
jgi:hypothetical protein